MSGQLSRQLSPLLPFGLLGSLWVLAVENGWIRPFFLPSPMAVGQALLDLFANGFGYDILISTLRILIGFLVAIAVAFPLGLVIGRSRFLAAMFEPLIDFIRYTPIAATIPLLILWFGIGEEEKIIVIALSVVFQLMLMVANSVLATPKDLIRAALTLGATGPQVLLRVILPHLAPRFVDDLRISLGWAWSSLMIAEIVGSTSGIGYTIIQAQRLLQTEAVVASILVIGGLGIVTDRLMKGYANWRYPWQRAGQDGERYA